MATQVEKRKKGKKKENAQQNGAGDDEDKIDPMEYKVAKYLRSKLPEKKTTMLGHKVQYFNAQRAVEVLLDSPWKDDLFPSRECIVSYLHTMLLHKFFHRAKKILVSKSSKKTKDDENVSATDTPKQHSKKRLKLDMHLEQIFVDANEPYVWIYDPIPLKAWIIGTGLVIGAIAICLFPLWPRMMRDGVYYLSVAAAGFLGVILALAVIRHILFFVIWAVSMGKHRFWMLPNLTEEVGFFESFWPLYDYEYRPSGMEPTLEDKKKTKKEKKDADDDNDDAVQKTSKSKSKMPSKPAEPIEAISERRRSTASSTGDEKAEGRDSSEEKGNSSDKGSSDFELVDKKNL